MSRIDRPAVRRVCRRSAWSLLCTACVAVAGCTIVDLEGMGLVSPTDGLVVGDTVSLSLIARDGSMPTGPQVDWLSTEPSIASVDEKGVVTAHSPGVAGIEAWTGDYRLRVPLAVWAPAGPFTTVDIGGSHACGLHDDGTLWCWGSDGFGQLGTVTRYEMCFTIAGPIWCAPGAVPVDSDVRFVALATGYYLSCALTAEGEAYCWGQDLEVPTPLEGGHVFRSLHSVGAFGLCGITTDDALLCWSTGGPTRVAGDHGFATVAASERHTCGVTTAGQTLCWGLNGAGQLGVADVEGMCGPYPCSAEPQEVSSAPPFVDLALGVDFSCGLTAGGEAWCWGANERGQLGDGTRTGRWMPAPVSGGHAFTRIAAGELRACGIDATYRLHCWGLDDTSFGTEAERIESDMPLPAAGDLALTELSIAGRSQCGLDRDGGAWCWGINGVAQLGNGGQHPRDVSAKPTRVIVHPAG